MSNIKDDNISDKQRELIGNKLNEKIKNLNCVMCGQQNWNMEPFIVPVPVSSDFSVKLGGQVLPLVSITCTNCGNTHFFNLAMLGLIDEIKNKKGDIK